MKMAEYKCSECDGVFETGWSDEEATAEFKATFGREMDPSVDASVCDDCYKRLMGEHSDLNHKIVGAVTAPDAIKEMVERVVFDHFMRYVEKDEFWTELRKLGEDKPQ